MQRLFSALLALCLALAGQSGVWAGEATVAPSPNPVVRERIVALGGSVTEIVFALGAGDRMVANDLSSLYPEAASSLPKVGYYRAVPLEGVLSMQPDLVLASEQSGPEQTFTRLEALGVTVLRVSDRPEVESLRRRVQTIAQALGRVSQGQILLVDWDKALDDARATPGQSLRTLVLMSRGGTPQGAGSGTAAAAIMALAGLENVLADHKGYHVLSPEGIGALAPEMIIVTSASVPAMGGEQALRQAPGIAQTPAARANRVVPVDDLLILGLGLRLPQAITLLKTAAGDGRAR